MNAIGFEDPMRELHTADWHIGQTLNGWSREREHEVFFARLADVLDNPSGESQRLLYWSFAEFKRRRSRLVTVILGGNHDPALHLEAKREAIGRTTGLAPATHDRFPERAAANTSLRHQGRCQGGGDSQSPPARQSRTRTGATAAR